MRKLSILLPALLTVFAVNIATQGQAQDPEVVSPGELVEQLVLDRFTPEEKALFTTDRPPYCGVCDGSVPPDPVGRDCYRKIIIDGELVCIDLPTEQCLEEGCIPYD